MCLLLRSGFGVVIATFNTPAEDIVVAVTFPFVGMVANLDVVFVIDEDDAGR